MRIATWNVQRLANPNSPRGTAVLDWMRAINADIWVLTETRECIIPGPEYGSVATSGSDRKQSPGEQWTMIWSRLPVLSQEPTSDPIRTVCVRLTTKSSGPILVYGTVLPWRGDVRWSPLRGAAAFVHALEAQQEDWRHLRQKYPDDLLCIAGDFNQELGLKSYAGSVLGKASLRQTLENVSVTCLTGDEADPVAQQTDNVRCNIDHICLDSRCDSSSVRRGVWPSDASNLKGLSDHFGVWVDVDGLG